MYIRSERVTNTYHRKSKLGNTVEYCRTKTIYIFVCDYCGAEFERDTNYQSTRLNNCYKHFCKKCKSKSSSVGHKNQKAKLDKLIGEKKIDSVGYVVIRMSADVPYPGKRSGKNYAYVREHTKIMQDHVGRRLEKDEVVHHIDGDKTNNSIENLDLCTKQQHNKCHATSEEIVFELYKRGLVGYDKRTKRYFLRDSCV